MGAGKLTLSPRRKGQMDSDGINRSTVCTGQTEAERLNSARPTVR